MAFNVQVRSLGKNKVRLVAAAAGGLKILHGAANALKLGLFGDATADVQLPQSFYFEPGFGGAKEDIVQVLLNRATADANPIAYRVVKGGNPWQIVVTNDDAANDGPDLEILVTLEHSTVR